MEQKIEYHLKNKKLYYYGSNQMKKEEKCKIEKLKIKKFLYCILVCMVVCITLQGTIYANEDENSEAQTFKIVQITKFMFCCQRNILKKQ